MKKISRSEAIAKIRDYFSLHNLEPEKTRKIKRLAMKFNIKLGLYRERFCKKCYADLKLRRTRITKTHKIITCKCGFMNKIKTS